MESILQLLKSIYYLLAPCACGKELHTYSINIKSTNNRSSNVCMHIVKNTLYLMFDCLELHLTLFPKNSIFAEVKFACFDTFQKLSYEVPSSCARSYVPATYDIRLYYLTQLYTYNSTYNCGTINL